MKHEDQIDTILINFDFIKVNKAMVALDWKWPRCGGVPTVQDLKQQAESLLMEAAKDEFVEVKTGGFCAIHRNGYLSLYFHITYWDCEDT